jgi:hypothetical protein
MDLDWRVFLYFSYYIEDNSDLTCFGDVFTGLNYTIQKKFDLIF